MIGKKQKTNEQDWLNALENIENIVSYDQLQNKVECTVNDIIEKTSGKKSAYCWSGGKDSIVLGRLCEMAGIYDCVLVVSDLEYPSFMNWVDVNKPKNLEIINTHQDIRWLQTHQEMLFPQDSATAGKWFHIVQHKGQDMYYKNHDLDILILGRRKADGNYVGNGSNIYTNKKGTTRFSPISDWTHEEILAFIHYYKCQLPPIYEWKNGYLCGTHAWAARQWTGSIQNGWKEVYDIDKNIVINAADYIASAKTFLSSLKE